eukprot:TRINITY_DN96967_c0_g1_i1.p1 TRINITY_DN96967_c0_g1~~TRINITY_DN96967_c0_g1_i1.p1  ORF type:complete len:154 (+),score=15.42 TRINITY_DN96967_c0_g1_i1:36-497(+)
MASCRQAQRHLKLAARLIANVPWSKPSTSWQTQTVALSFSGGKRYDRAEFSQRRFCSDSSHGHGSPNSGSGEFRSGEGYEEEPKEPPLWILASGPAAMVLGAVLISARGDIVGMFGDHQVLKSGGWPCPSCLSVNKAEDDVCSRCNAKRPSHL